MAVGRGGANFTGCAKRNFRDLSDFASTHAVKRLIYFSISQREVVSSEAIGNLSNLSSGF